MRDTGKMTRLKEEAVLSTVMAMYMKESGKKTRLTGEASTFIFQGLPMKEIGWKTSSMVLELRDGKMERIIKESINMAGRMERVNLCGLTAHPSRETL